MHMQAPAGRSKEPLTSRLVPLDRASHEAARRTFARRKIVRLGRLFRPDVARDARSEADRLMRTAGRRRELVIPSTGHSPRRYSNVSRDAVVRDAGILAALYDDPDLRALIADVAGEPRIFTVPYPPEEIVLARMERAGDSHGWHWDDYAFSLVWVLEAPDPLDGGAIEYVCDTVWNKADPQIEAYLARDVSRMHLARDEAYLIDGTVVMHRVAPLLRDARRTIVCYSYARADDLTRVVTHETLEALYAEDAVS